MRSSKITTYLLILLLILWMGILFLCLQSVRQHLNNDFDSKPSEKLHKTRDISAQSTTEAGPHYIYPIPRDDFTRNISMIIILTQGTDGMANYERSLNSLECYARIHKYGFYMIIDDKYDECQIHKDKFFRRHCTIWMFMMREIREYDWILVMDADIAVINPNKLIEDYIDMRFDITLFDRFFNFEVAALSYLVRNTKVAREFVDQFARMEFKLPDTLAHGTDNGALHPYLMELLAPGPSPIKDMCYRIWNVSSAAYDLFQMETCTRMVMGDRIEYPEKNLRILRKGTAWVRDLWLLHGFWSEDDFMFHGAKEANFREYSKEKDDPTNMTTEDMIVWLPLEKKHAYVFPLIEELDLATCSNGNSRWVLDGRLKISNQLRRKVLRKFENGVIKMKLAFIGQMAKFFYDDYLRD